MTASNPLPKHNASSIFLIFLVTLVFVVAIGFLLIVVNGNIIKHQYMKLIGVINSETHLQIQIVEYKPGWFCSHAKLYIPMDDKLALSYPNRANSLLSNHGLTLEQDITHGPVLFDSLHKTYAFAPAFIRSHMVFTNADHQSILTLAKLDTLVTFQNEYFTQFMIPKFKNTSSNEPLSFEGLKGKMFFNVSDSHIKRFRLDITSGSFDFKSDGIVLAIGSGQTNADFKQSPMDEWDGVHHVELASITYHLNNQRYQLTKLNYASHYKIIKDNNYTHLMNGDIATLSFPDISFNSISFASSIENIDPRPLNELTSQSAGHISLSQLNQWIPALIKQNTVLSGKLEANSSFGKLAITEKAIWPQNIALPTTLESILQQVSVSVNVRMSVNLLNKLISIIGREMDASFQALPQTIVTPGQQLDQSIDKLVADNKISTFAGSQLKDFQKTKPSVDNYYSYVDHLLVMKEINSDVGAWLKNQYQGMYQAQASPTVSAPLPPKSYEQHANETIADAIQKGYIIQDQNDYLSTIVIDRGVVKLNGKVLGN